MRAMLKDILQKSGQTIVGETTDEKEVTKQYKQLNPDIVTKDITIPEMDGVAGLKGMIIYDSNAVILRNLSA